MGKKKVQRDDRAAWLRALRSPRHWCLGDVERLIVEAEERGESPREYSLGLGLDRGRVDRWLRRHAELTSAPKVAPSSGSGGVAERAVLDAFVELRAASSTISAVGATFASPSVVLMHLAGGVMVEVPASLEGARFVAAVASNASGTRATCG